MKAEDIAKEIFYLPATNNKAKESIEHGAKLIQDYAEQRVKEFAEWAGISYIRLTSVWGHKYENQMGSSNWKTTDELIKIWKEQQ